MIASPASVPTATSSWYQEKWSQQTNLCEVTVIQPLNVSPHRMWGNLDVERPHSQESLWKFRTPSAGDINRLSCDIQLLWTPNVAIIPYTPTNWSQSFLHSNRKSASPGPYYSEYRDSPTYRSYRPEWLSIPHNHQSANPPHRESLYLQEEHSKFGKEDRGNGHFPPQAALINSHPVPSREASLGPLPFVNWHSTYVFMGTDLDVTGDPSASPKCVTGRKMGWPTRCRDPIVSVPFQTQSRHDGSASPIPPEGSRDVFAGYFEKDPIISDEYPKQEPDYNATRTSPLEQDNPDDESLVKKRVSSLRVRTTSRARRKVEARFICPISRCGGTFTRKKNLEYHLNSHLGIRNHVCTCLKSFNTKASLKRHRLLSCSLG